MSVVCSSDASHCAFLSTLLPNTARFFPLTFPLADGDIFLGFDSGLEVEGKALTLSAEDDDGLRFLTGACESKHSPVRGLMFSLVDDSGRGRGRRPFREVDIAFDDSLGLTFSSTKTENVDVIMAGCFSKNMCEVNVGVQDVPKMLRMVFKKKSSRNFCKRS